MLVPETNAIAPERMGAWLYLDEVMHRVLNDYTVMLSTVRLAAMKVSDAQTGEALDDVTLRLNTAAATFRALSPPRDRRPRDLDEELGALCASLSKSVLAPKGIELTFVADPIQVSALRCWKICLVASELINNAARHAFHGRPDGALVVELSVAAGMIRCAVLDNGAAPAGIMPGRGSRILDALAGELDGTLHRRHTGRGSAIVLEVPMAEVTAPPLHEGALLDHH